jgi:hypothetical protein
MKRIFAILVTVTLVVCGAVPAMAAYFDNQNLILVAYNWDDKEVAVDLGNYQTTDFNVKGQTLAAAGSVSLTKFGNLVDSWDDLHVGVYTGFSDSSSVKHFVFGTTSDTPNSVNKVANVPFSSASTLTHTLYGTGSDQQVVTVSALDNNSYTNLMDGSAYGKMAGYNKNPGDAGLSLSALSTVGYIDLYLWERIGATTQNLVPNVSGDQHQGMVRLYANGSITSGPAPVVPIPGALVLFASGLVGLIGIKRKNS